MSATPRSQRSPTLAPRRKHSISIPVRGRGSSSSSTIEDIGLLITSDLSARLEANYLLKTDDEVPAYIAVKTNGWRTGPEEVMRDLMNPERADGVEPDKYKFLLFVQMETGDARYKDVNRGMWVGSGVRRRDQVIYDAYRVN